MYASTIKHIFYIALLLLISGVVAWQTENFYLGVLAFAIVGFLLESGDWAYDHVRMNTRAFFAPLGKQGHSSIIEEDIIELRSLYETDVTYLCFRPGGSSVYWLPLHGMDDIYIIRSDLIDQQPGAVLAIGDYYVPAFTDLPVQWQKQIYETFHEGRTMKFSPKTHKIFYAETRTAKDGILAEKDKEGVNYGERFLRLEAVITSLKQKLEDQLTINMSLLNIDREIHGTKEKSENRKEE